MPYDSNSPPIGERILSRGVPRIDVPIPALRELDLAGGEHAGPIVTADEQFVGAVEAHGVGHVDVERLVPAEAAAHALAVEIHAAVELHAAEVQRDPLAAKRLRHGEAAAKPRPLIVHAVEIARHCARSPVPAGRRIAQFRDSLVLPRPIERNLLAGFTCRERGTKDAKGDGAEHHSTDSRGVGRPHRGEGCQRGTASGGKAAWMILESRTAPTSPAVRPVHRRMPCPPHRCCRRPVCTGQEYPCPRQESPYPGQGFRCYNRGGCRGGGESAVSDWSPSSYFMESQESMWNQTVSGIAVGPTVLRLSLVLLFSLTPALAGTGEVGLASADSLVPMQQVVPTPAAVPLVTPARGCTSTERSTPMTCLPTRGTLP